MRDPIRALVIAAAGILVSPVVGAQVPDCAASSDEPRDSAAVIAAVAAARCAPGSRLRVAMTTAGQAIVLQQSGICTAESFRTMTRRPTPETRVLGVTCTLAAR